MELLSTLMPPFRTAKAKTNTTFSPKESHDKFKDKYKIKFDLLADEEIKVLKKYKVWGKKKFMGREFMGIIRTTYLIDKKGRTLKIWDNVKVKEHAKEVLETLKSIVKK